MEGKLYLLNGELKTGEFYVNSSNRSFKYGDGLFETIHVSQSYPLFYRSHYSRFIHGLDALGLNIPDFFTFQYFLNCLKSLINEQEIINGTIRLQAFRKGEGVYRPQTNEFEWIAEIVNTREEAFYPLSPETYTLGIFEDFRINDSPISFFKSSNSLPYVLASDYANSKQFDNVVLLNDRDQVVETIAENIFVYSEGLVRTPPISSGAVDGVMRSVIKKLLKWNQISFEESPLKIQDLQHSQEIFLTNTSKGIISVTDFDERHYFQSFAKGLQLKLNERVAQILERG